MSLKTQRCGACANCQRVEKTRSQMLAISTKAQMNSQQPGLGHNDGTVAVWNDTLRDYPCTEVK